MFILLRETYLFLLGFFSRLPVGLCLSFTTPQGLCEQGSCFKSILGTNIEVLAHSMFENRDSKLPD